MVFLLNRARSLTVAGLLALALGGCAGSGANVPALGTGAAGPADSTAGATSCGGAIAHFEKVITADADTGNLNQSVFKRVVADLAPVKASCSAGKDAQARAQLASVRARYGYP